VRAAIFSLALAAVAHAGDFQREAQRLREEALLRIRSAPTTFLREHFLAGKSIRGITTSMPRNSFAGNPLRPAAASQTTGPPMMRAGKSTLEASIIRIPPNAGISCRVVSDREQIPGTAQSLTPMSTKKDTPNLPHARSLGTENGFGLME
jgi:hypothetical protein